MSKRGWVLSRVDYRELVETKANKSLTRLHRRVTIVYRSIPRVSPTCSQQVRGTLGESELLWNSVMQKEITYDARTDA